MVSSKIALALLGCVRQLFVVGDHVSMEGRSSEYCQNKVNTLLCSRLEASVFYESS